jgi:hypothetical protein
MLTPGSQNSFSLRRADARGENTRAAIASDVVFEGGDINAVSSGDVVFEGGDINAVTKNWDARAPWETSAMPSYDYRRANSTHYQFLLEGMAVCRDESATMLPLLEELQKQDFFALFPFDLMASCRYMPTEESPCDLEACEVEPADYDYSGRVPEKIIARDTSEYDFKIDGWIREDMPSDFTDYYDLRLTPEKNTGYDGSRVWRFIHQKLCFQDEVMKPENGWKRDFNRAISGMHAAVDTHIIEDIGFNEQGLAEYHRRLRDEPGSIVNLYFAYMLTLDALREMRERLDNCNYLGDGEEIRPIMTGVTGSKLASSQELMRNADTLRVRAKSCQGNLYKARLRIRDLFSIMDCVQCNLCRLHGKTMVLGLGATFQVLLGRTGSGGDPKELDRVQVAALVATAAKFGTACATIEKFRELDGADVSKPFDAAVESTKKAVAKIVA